MAHSNGRHPEVLGTDAPRHQRTHGHCTDPLRLDRFAVSHLRVTVSVKR
jgi:hypothetical protein